ncbi:MAG: ABC transporter substrate-binding protein [Anaerolineae bacterium]|nr:ABC transporter substrate-binding protein [Anaerolineae bacterium]
MKRLFALLVMILLIGATPVIAQDGPTATPEATAAPDPLGGATEFARANERTLITIMLDWTPNTNHLGLYVAQARGYYDEASLDVTIQPAGDIQVEQVVALGQAQFGISYQETFTYARAEGTPIVSVAAIIQHNTSGFAALADRRTLNSPADLVGLRYGGFGSAIERPVINSLITCAGGQPDSFEVIDIGFVEAFPLMERDRIDFVWLFYGWDGIRAERQGLDLSLLMLKDYTDCVPDYYTPILITGETMIAEQPDVVRAFVQATARGYADAIVDSAGAAAIMLDAAPDLDRTLVEASAAWLAGEFQADAPRWGEQRAEIWDAFTAYMVENGALAEPIDSATAFTNDFLPGAAE